MVFAQPPAQPLEGHFFLTSTWDFLQCIFSFSIHLWEEPGYILSITQLKARQSRSPQRSFLMAEQFDVTHRVEEGAPHYPSQ